MMDLEEKKEKLVVDVREKIEKMSGNPDEKFHLNRHLWRRLRYDERKVKYGEVKENLLEKTETCWHCGEELPEKGVVIHRKNPDRRYTEENSELVHRKCHEEIHSG